MEEDVKQKKEEEQRKQIENEKLLEQQKLDEMMRKEEERLLEVCPSINYFNALLIGPVLTRDFVPKCC